VQLFKTGDRVVVAYEGRGAEGVVLLASANGRSLMLGFDAALGLPGAGAYVGMMPILWDEERRGFYDLIMDRPVKISGVN